MKGNSLRDRARKLREDIQRTLQSHRKFTARATKRLKEVWEALGQLDHDDFAMDEWTDAILVGPGGEDLEKKESKGGVSDFRIATRKKAAAKKATTKKKTAKKATKRKAAPKKKATAKKAAPKKATKKKASAKK